MFQLHLWLGIGAGLYVLLIALTGAAALFRQDLQRAAYPAFFAPARAINAGNAELATVLADVATRYPGYSVAGVDWPTYRRDTFLTYVSRDGELRTVFSHPVSGRVSGELPDDWIRRLQDLHFDLLGGPTGRTINGTGGIALMLMALSGIVVWWPVRRRQWSRSSRALHVTTGVAIAALTLLWGMTGTYYGFARPLRSALSALLPLTVVSAPESGADAGLDRHLEPSAFVARARQQAPGAQLARIVLPSAARSAVLVVMARRIHGDYDTRDEVLLWFDRYTGALLGVRDQGVRTWGDTVLAWITPLHTGSFGGWRVKIVWAAGALGLAVLVGTGLTMAGQRYR